MKKRVISADSEVVSGTACFAGTPVSARMNLFPNRSPVFADRPIVLKNSFCATAESLALFPIQPGPLPQGENPPNKCAPCAPEPRNAQVVDNQEWHFEVHGQGESGSDSLQGTGVRLRQNRSTCRLLSKGRGEGKETVECLTCPIVSAVPCVAACCGTILKPFRKFHVAAVALALFLASLAPAFAATKRPGKVQFSNGDAVEGTLSLTPGADLRLHINGNQVRVLDFERVHEIRVSPVEEQMVQKWRFLEAGQTKKEFSGKPYLIRSLQATVFLAGGEKITGHLYTTVFYLEEGEKARKVILPAKQRGKEGEGANALVFPSLITFTDTAAGTEETIRLRIAHPDVTAQTEVAAVTWEALFTFEGRKTGQAGEYKLPSPLGRDLILGFKTGNRIVVGWPKTADPKFTTIVQTNLANNEDFYDDRKLLGVYYDEPHTDIYSLLMLHRKGHTTMDGAKTQPWRLVVLRWKFDPESQRVLLAGRGFLFRGILAKGEEPPPVTLADKLWKPRKQGEVWVAGE